jgi:hypothetical protein
VRLVVRRVVRRLVRLVFRLREEKPGMRSDVAAVLSADSRLLGG